MGWFVGYDGHFHFDNIGDSYISNNVPYVAFRALPALLGALTIPVVFLIMWESGYSLPACIIAASLVLFDNAHIGQTRLILLDATLVFAMSVSVLCYVRFYKMRHDPFSRKWWKWLLLTGVAMSCVISTKYVGVFTFFTIGSAVAIDLWGLLDVNRKEGALNLPTFAKHFGARLFGLIVVPFFFYLFWFQVHFAILSRSGPGDDFMSPEFQSTLSDNIMASSAVGIEYYDTIAMKHKETKTYLHSHPDKYPLRYDDGRVSSQGQQVTGYPFSDENNHWQILPMNLFPEDNQAGHPVKNGELVRLRHLITDTYLLTHDVASPYYPTNQEYTAVGMEEAYGERANDTLFEIKIENGKAGQQFKSMSGHFKLIHFPTRVAMWTHTTPLPDWAYKQAEINGNKNVQQSSNVWFVDVIPSIPKDSPRLIMEERKVKYVPFLKKYFELQRAIFFHNNALTSSHPYSSQPIQWPFLLRGVSFWTQNDTKQQIYFLGNPIGWWIASSLLAVFAGIIGADQLSLRRGVDSLGARKSLRHPYLTQTLTTPFPNIGDRSRLYNSTGFFFLCWAAHYLPFYLMGRQLFLHHYLPAHLASALVTGALLEFICNLDPLALEEVASNNTLTNGAKSTKNVDSATKKDGVAPGFGKKHLTAKERMGHGHLLALWGMTGLVLALVIGGWWFFLPLTYGKPGLDPEQVNARKWLGYDLHFAK
jgi:dolichyl-phosphate-mannose-protein mannosyltransferase